MKGIIEAKISMSSISSSNDKPIKSGIFFWCVSSYERKRKDLLSKDCSCQKNTMPDKPKTQSEVNLSQNINTPLHIETSQAKIFTPHHYDEINFQEKEPPADGKLMSYSDFTMETQSHSQWEKKELEKYKDESSYTTKNNLSRMCCQKVDSRSVGKKGNEFEAFGKSVAVQLENMPLELALRVQNDVQCLITKMRLNFITPNSMESSTISVGSDTFTDKHMIEEIPREDSVIRDDLRI